MNDQPDFRAFLQALPDPCLVLSSDLTVRAANDAFLSTTGLRSEELLDRRLLDDVFPDPPAGEALDGRRQLRASLISVISTGNAHVVEVHRYDLPTGPRRSLRRRYWSVVNSPILAPDGTVQHLSMRILDVTAARGLFAASIATLTTELDNGHPLTSAGLQNFAEYLTDAGRGGRDTEEILGQVAELLTVLQARTVIEQAKGMLMATQRISAEQAYSLLVRESQHTNTKLRDVAAHHVALTNGPEKADPAAEPIRRLAAHNNVA